MSRARKSDATRQRILNAAAREFVEKGFEGASISQVASRAKLSKQLVHHHFTSKDELFATVHEQLFRPSTAWDGEVPARLENLIAERFAKRAQNMDYMRVLTWEAASIRSGPVPGEQERQQRISQYATEIRLLQAQGKLPQDLDYRMLQLTILALASYPLSFAQVTRLVTGRPGTDPAFQRDWIQHLRKLTQMLLLSGSPTQKAAPAPKRTTRSRKARNAKAHPARR